MYIDFGFCNWSIFCQRFLPLSLVQKIGHCNVSSLLEKIRLLNHLFHLAKNILILSLSHSWHWSKSIRFPKGPSIALINNTFFLYLVGISFWSHHNWVWFFFCCYIKSDLSISCYVTYTGPGLLWRSSFTWNWGGESNCIVLLEIWGRVLTYYRVFQRPHWRHFGLGYFVGRECPVYFCPYLASIH